MWVYEEGTLSLFSTAILGLLICLSAFISQDLAPEFPYSLLTWVCGSLIGIKPDTSGLCYGKVWVKWMGVYVLTVGCYSLIQHFDTFHLNTDTWYFKKYRKEIILTLVSNIEECWWKHRKYALCPHALWLQMEFKLGFAFLADMYPPLHNELQTTNLYLQILTRVCFSSKLWRWAVATGHTDDMPYHVTVLFTAWWVIWMWCKLATILIYNQPFTARMDWA